jgi:hypothetical protein
MFRIAGRQADFRGQAAQGTDIEVRFRVEERPVDRVRIGVRCMAAYLRHPASTAAVGEPAGDAAQCAVAGGAMLDVTHAFKSAPIGVWQTLSYSLSCFGARGADLSNVEAPLAIQTAGRFALTISEVRLMQRRGPEHCE